MFFNEKINEYYEDNNVFKKRIHKIFVDVSSDTQ